MSVSMSSAKVFELWKRQECTVFKRGTLGYNHGCIGAYKARFTGVKKRPETVEVSGLLTHEPPTRIELVTFSLRVKRSTD